MEREGDGGGGDRLLNREVTQVGGDRGLGGAGGAQLRWSVVWTRPGAGDS